MKEPLIINGAQISLEQPASRRVKINNHYSTMLITSHSFIFVDN